MASFTALKTAIQNAIKQNGNEEITGDVLQQILLSIVNTMGDGAINTIEQNLSSETLARQGADNTLQSNINAEALARGNADTQLQNAINAIKANIDNGYVYAGIATPKATPVSGKVFYIATAAGTYTNFGGQVLTQGINILRYNGSEWSNQQLIGIDDVPTAGSNNLLKSGGVQNELALGAVYDVSAKNPTGGPNNDGKWESLSALLSDANLNTLIPTAYRKGGMSIKFVHTSDNKYVQFRLMSDAFNTTIANWQGVDDEPTAGSDNLVKSGGVETRILQTETKTVIINEDVDLLTDAEIGKYIATNGTIGTLSVFNYSDVILLERGYTITVVAAGGVNGNISIISKPRTDGNFDSLVAAPDNVVREYSYKNTSESDMQVVVCYQNGLEYGAVKEAIHPIIKSIDGVVQELESEVELIEEEIAIPDVTVDLLTNHLSGYINQGGSYGESPSFNTSAPFEISDGATLIIRAAGSVNGNISVLSDFYGSGSYKALIVAPDNVVRDYVYKNTTGHVKTVAVTYQNALEYSAVIKLNKPQKSSANFSMFEKFGVVGDSYASGAIQHNGGMVDYYNLSWGQVLSRNCGNTCINFSAGGLTTRTWLTHSDGLSKLQSSDAQQLYICNLGLNDYTNLGQNYLGTLSDIELESDTFYGNYGKIINAIKTKAPNAKIIMMTMANDSTSVKHDYNEAIINIANYFEIPYIDERKSNFFNSLFYYNGLVGAHPISVVYSGMAKEIRTLIEKVMVDSYLYFVDYIG